jgi:hypothetical protein
MEMGQMMACLLAEVRTDREDMLARTDANQARMNASLREEIKSGQAEMKSTVNTFQEKMDAWISNMRDDRKETMSCQVMMKRVWRVRSQIRKTRNLNWNMGGPYGRGWNEIFGNNEEAARAGI